MNSNVRMIAMIKSKLNTLVLATLMTVAAIVCGSIH